MAAWSEHEVGGINDLTLGPNSCHRANAAWRKSPRECPAGGGLCECDDLGICEVVDGSLRTADPFGVVLEALEGAAFHGEWEYDGLAALPVSTKAAEIAVRALEAAGLLKDAAAHAEP